jgi:hypothetical protein
VSFEPTRVVPVTVGTWIARNGTVALTLALVTTFVEKPAALPVTRTETDLPASAFATV